MAYLPGLGDCYGYVEGYRYWLWDNVGQTLESLVTSTHWFPHQVLEAKGVDLIKKFYSPGIHAYKSRPEDNGYWIWSVLGRVALWGKIVEHEDGYRAQFAYPVEFIELNCNRVPASIYYLMGYNIPGYFLSIQDLTRLYLTPPGENSCKSETQLELIQSPQLKYHNPSEARHRRLMYLRKLKWKKQE